MSSFSQELEETKNRTQTRVYNVARNMTQHECCSRSVECCCQCSAVPSQLVLLPQLAKKERKDKKKHRKSSSSHAERICLVFYCLFVTGNYSLRINLEDFDGNQRYAEYKNFKVDDEKVLILTDGNCRKKID